MSKIKWLLGEEPSSIGKLLFLLRYGKNKGAYGEYLITYLIRRHIRGHYRIFRNVYIPYRNTTSEVDILLIHEKGIFVFESKNYKGWIFGDAEERYWSQFINKGTKNLFYNPILQNNSHINAVTKFLNIDKKMARSYIVFSDKCELKDVPKNTSSYKVLKREKLVKTLKKDLSKRKKVFSRFEVDKMAFEIFPKAHASWYTKWKHKQYIKKRYGNNNSNGKR